MGTEEEEDHNEPTTRAASILDKRPLRIFGHPLTTTQQMWLGFLVPALISTIIFLANFALDIAVAYQLFRDQHPLLAGITIAFVYTPSLACFVLTCARLPNLESVCDRISWVTIQFLQSLLFPVGIIFRFATRLFWSTVALTEEDPEREKALRIAEERHHTELFFFLDSFLNAAPQAILQAYILLSPQIVTANETAWTQAVSIITSVIALSRTAALYQRFESQRVVGRSIPWTRQQNEAHSRSLVRITQLDPYFLMGQQKQYQNQRTKPKALSLVITHESSSQEPQHNKTEHQDEIAQTSEVPEVRQVQQEPHQAEQMPCTNPAPGPSQNQTSLKNEAGAVVDEKKANNVDQNLQDTNDHSTQDPQDHDALLGTKPSTQSNDSQTSNYLDPIRADNVPIEERCFWPRIQTPPSSPTADPHMRPRLSINTIRSQNRPAYTSSVALPVRKLRTKGLQEDEPLGIFAVFNAWVTYLLARVLVIAAFTHFYLWPSVGMILSHYAIMVAYLYFCNPCLNFWAPLMGLVFILCPIEVKIRYKHPRIFLISFFALVLLEDLASVVLWYCGAEWDSWWYDFAFAFIIGCHGMAALNASLYLFLFKPKAKYVD